MTLIVKSKPLIILFFMFTVFVLPRFSSAAVGTITTEYQLSPSLSAQWSGLLHYRDGISSINSHDFFLSAQGNHNLEAELQSTIAAFSQSSTNMHCRYPARYLWIRHNLNIDFGISLESCKDFRQWKEDNPAESISLIYVTGYLGNPASFFGHLLMKLNKEEGSDTDIELLDSGINFGADAGQEDNPIKYVTYGIFGGYSARYTAANYYLHTASYAENEQRELWEYELNLTSQEVELLQAHLWELQEVKFSYYFLSENCSTAMADIISIVLDKPLLSGYQPWDMPVDIFHALPNVQHNGGLLLKAVKQRESKFTRVKRKYLALSREEKQWTLALAGDIGELNNFIDLEITDYSKAKVLDVLTEYVELLIVTDEESSVEYRERKRRLLVARLTLDSFSVDWPSTKAQPPHKAQLPIKLGVGAGYSDKFGPYTSLSGYAAYYDFLSIDTARSKDSSITVLESEIHFTDDNIRLKNLDIINIASLNTNDVKLFENKQLAWQVKWSVEQDDCVSSSCYRTYMEGYLGLADRWSDSLTVYSMFGPQIDLSYIDDSNVQLPTGFLYSWSDKWKTHITITPDFSFNTGKADISSEITSRFSLNNEADIRIRLAQEDDLSLSLYYNIYF